MSLVHALSWSGGVCSEGRGAQRFAPPVAMSVPANEAEASKPSEDDRQLPASPEQKPVLNLGSDTSSIVSMPGSPGTMRSSRCSILTIPMDPELLRAVPLDLVLARFGRHLEPPDQGMMNVDSKLYHLSRQVDRIDHFLSHDWSTARRWKVCALLVLFNTVPACLVTTFLSFTFGFVLSIWAPGYKDLVGVERVWRVSMGMTSFWLCLCLWQRIRRLWKQNVVFLDKLCIAQHDEELKKKGIFGLSTFLEHSETLTILWSRRYFSRLWCVFELCTFLRHEHNKRVVMMPVNLASLFLLVIVLNQVVTMMNVLFDTVTGLSVSAQITIRSLLVIPAYAVMIDAGMELIRDLRDLSKQLQDFSVDRAECFCCSNKHIHPTTGQALPCDRELVVETLGGWFGSTRAFEWLVRERLTQNVENSIRAVLTAQYPLYVAVASTSPLLILKICEIAEEDSISVDLVVTHFADWCKLPLVNLLSIWLMILACQCGACISRTCRWAPRTMVALVLSCLALVMLSPFWAFMELLDVYSSGKAGLLVFPVIFLLWLHGICRSKLMRVPRENKMENWEAPRFKRNSVSRQKDMGNMEAGQVEYVTSTEIDNVSTFST
ncbi:unnamed protein product [Durusdinium trenchii]|uniref:Transmembrane protein n=1 Tax=Durusdinium trenchii TaxID=1381693 RepID=A0ABP0R7S7_9DINO